MSYPYLTYLCDDIYIILCIVFDVIYTSIGVFTDVSRSN